MAVFIVFPLHWSPWQVHITTNQKDCHKCFQCISINGKTMISLRDCISDYSSQLSFIISSVKKILKYRNGWFYSLQHWFRYNVHLKYAVNCFSFAILLFEYALFSQCLHFVTLITFPLRHFISNTAELK